MNEKGFLFIAEIMQSWLDSGEDVVGLKANHIMEEASKFVGFGLDLDKGPSIPLNIVDVASNLVLEVLHVEF